MSQHPSPGPSARLKHIQPVVGIAAGAEDAKYQAKYRELKRKVKEIEADNDRLHCKVLQTKQGIQRMKLERAILYERLAGISSPNEPQNRAILHQPVSSSFSRSHSGNTHDLHDIDYPVLHERQRVISGPPRIHSPPPPRRAPPPPQLDSRHIPHLLPPPNSRPHVSPTLHHSQSASSHSHHRTRSQSSSRSRSHQQPYISGHPNQYSEGFSPVLRSPPLERERSRHEGPLRDTHPSSRLSSYIPRLSPPPPPEARRVHSHSRMSPGPAQLTREEYDHQHDRELEHERERERERERGHPRDLGRNREHPNSMVSPPLSHRRQAFDRGGGNDYPPEPLGSSRSPPWYGPIPPSGGSGYAPHSRSGTPVSGSGSGNGGAGPGAGMGVGDASRQDSRHYYEPARQHELEQQQHEQRPRPRGGTGGGSAAYMVRGANPPNEEMDFVHEDGRSRDRGGFEGSVSSRKRGRSDMDVDDDVGDPSSAAYSTGRGPEDRGKRYHREHRRSVDDQEDGHVRMGPP